MIARKESNGNELVSISSHAITKTRQRFSLRDKKRAVRTLKEALKEGEVVQEDNKYNFVLKYKNMYLVVDNNVLKTVLTKDMYENDYKLKKSDTDMQMFERDDQGLGGGEY